MNLSTYLALSYDELKNPEETKSILLFHERVLRFKGDPFSRESLDKMCLDYYAPLHELCTDDYEDIIVNSVDENKHREEKIDQNVGEEVLMIRVEI